MQRRTIRYQAAIVQDDHVLLLRVLDRDSGVSFWLFPGGGQEANESPETCVKREVWEETCLHVSVEGFLFAMPDIPGGTYDYLYTYLCHIQGGSARPGIEPEIDTPEHTTIQEIGWFDLQRPEVWDTLVQNDPITYPHLRQLRISLGYETLPPSSSSP